MLFHVIKPSSIENTIYLHSVWESVTHKNTDAAWWGDDDDDDDDTVMFYSFFQ